MPISQICLKSLFLGTKFDSAPLLGKTVGHTYLNFVQRNRLNLNADVECGHLFVMNHFEMGIMVCNAHIL